ncbi:WAS/WASL-interacting protein family member 3-like [Saccopteryx leptura]|uniref:WAS/WASL-interacting protein family member 3-like n=1 Tax=Saccopteryx leptura TaxID=249018 RepID=UPI00339CB263
MLMIPCSPQTRSIIQGSPHTTRPHLEPSGSPKAKGLPFGNVSVKAEASHLETLTCRQAARGHSERRPPPPAAGSRNFWPPRPHRQERAAASDAPEDFATDSSGHSKALAAVRGAREGPGGRAETNALDSAWDGKEISSHSEKLRIKDTEWRKKDFSRQLRRLTYPPRLAGALASGRLRLSRPQRPPGGAPKSRAEEQGLLVREEWQEAPPPSEPGTPLAVNRKPGGGGEERRHRNFPPRLERRQPGLGLGLPGHRSPVRALPGPPPPPAPPLPRVNGQRWSLNRALNHLNAICAPGPHLLPPTAARSVTPLPTDPARPLDPAANRAAAYSNCRAGAAPRMLRCPPLAQPQGPTGVVVLVREVAGAESPARERAAGGAAPATKACLCSVAWSSSRPRRETQVSRGWAGGAVQAAVSIVSPLGTRRCLGTVGYAAALGLLGPRLGSGELLSPSRPRPGLVGAGPAQTFLNLIEDGT